MKNLIFLTSISLVAACGNTEPTETTETTETTKIEPKAEVVQTLKQVEAKNVPPSKVEAVKATPKLSYCTDLFDEIMDAVEGAGFSEKSFDDSCCEVPNFKSVKADDLAYAVELGIVFCE